MKTKTTLEKWYDLITKSYGKELTEKIKRSLQKQAEKEALKRGVKK